MLEFFVGWALWLQMTFVLFGALIVVIGIGVGRNVYTWRRNRKYIQLLGPPSETPPALQQDIEAQMVADEDAIPFGIRALQQGVEVEGVWISQPNTPAPGSPVISAIYSGTPSIIGGSSSLASPSGNISPPELPNFDIPIPRPNQPNAPRIPSFILDSFHEGMVDSLEQVHEHQAQQHSSALEALEGRARYLETRSLDESRYETRRARSEYTMTITTGSSVRGGSPSPPALTDGTSRADTPLSMDVRPHLSAYLSESNHRLSHVAETGQLTPRVRIPRSGDSIVIPAIDPLAYKSTFSFNGVAPMVRSPQKASTNTAISMTRASLSDSVIPTLHAPKPVLAVRKPTFDLQSLHPDLSPSEGTPLTTHVRTHSGSLLFAGHQPSPILAEYMSNSFKDESVPVIRDFTARHTLHNSDVVSHAPTADLAAEQPSSLEFRKVNSDFEVKRGTMGQLTIPFDPPPLPLEKPSAAATERRGSRKLQKRSRAKSMAT